MLLAIDTATRFMSLALHDGQELLYEATWHTANNHTVELAPAIDRALRHIGLKPADLAAVAIAQGPGSFTGLRIGLGLAKGLVMAHRAALVAVPTLEIVAAGVPVVEDVLVAVLQAGRGRVCAQTFRRADGAWTAAAPAAITTWDALASALRQPTLVAGEIDTAGRNHLTRAGILARLAPGAVGLRRAGFLAEIAWARVRAGATDDPDTIAPIYLHQPGVPHP